VPPLNSGVSYHMKRAAIVMSIIGVASGFAFALGAWVFGVSDDLLATIVVPTIFGGILVMTHWLTLRRFKSSSPRRAGLLVSNIALMAIMTLGVLSIAANPYYVEYPFARMIYIAVLAVLFMGPLVSNVFHLASRRW
jgi:hypothetical protein